MSDSEAKVEQFLLLAKSARGLALADLIVKATAEPGLYAFGEFLSLPAVQELQGGDHASAYALLQLFAYGTWDDFKSAADSYPALSDHQQLKLKLLTVVTMANACRTIQYADLLSRLGLPNVRALEDLLIGGCLYGGLLRGKLDQAGGCLRVEDAFARDVRPEGVGGVAAALSDWLSHAQGVMAGIEARVAETGEASVAAQRRKAELESALEAERKSVKTSVELTTQQDMAGHPLDDVDAFSLAGMGPEGGDGDAARPGAGRHSKRRR